MLWSTTAICLDETAVLKHLVTVAVFIAGVMLNMNVEREQEDGLLCQTHRLLDE